MKYIALSTLSLLLSSQVNASYSNEIKNEIMQTLPSNKSSSEDVEPTEKNNIPMPTSLNGQSMPRYADKFEHLKNSAGESNPDVTPADHHNATTSIPLTDADTDKGKNLNSSLHPKVAGENYTKSKTEKKVKSSHSNSDVKKKRKDKHKDKSAESNPSSKLKSESIATDLETENKKLKQQLAEQKARNIELFNSMSQKKLLPRQASIKNIVPNSAQPAVGMPLNEVIETVANTTAEQTSQSTELSKEDPVENGNTLATAIDPLNEKEEAKDEKDEEAASADAPQSEQSSVKHPKANVVNKIANGINNLLHRKNSVGKK